MTNLTNAVIAGYYARSPFTFALKGERAKVRPDGMNGNSVTAY